MSMMRVLETMEYAIRKHDGQFRKITGEPYICHPVRVAAIAEYYVRDNSISKEKITQICLLHDVIEDTDTTYGEIKDLYSSRVADVVRELTNPDKIDGEKRADYKKRINQRLSGATDLAKQIKMCDRLDNLRGRSSSILPSDVKWLQKYAAETKDLVAAIGDANLLLANAILAEVARVEEDMRWLLEKA